MIRKNKAGKQIVVRMVDERAFGCDGAFQAGCCGCQRASKEVRKVKAHEWADQHARTCTVG